jgi:hypothetical protein
VQWDILATVLLTATIQSRFGVGVLLLGTPILLLPGYGSLTTLTILLPISPLLTSCGSTRTIDTFPPLLPADPHPLCSLGDALLPVVTTLKINIGGIVGLLSIMATDHWGHKPIFLIGFGILPIRGCIRLATTHFLSSPSNCWMASEREFLACSGSR